MDRPNIQEIIAALAGESVEERKSAAKSLRDLAKRGISTKVDVARSAEMRRALYQELGKLGALLRFPEEFRTQAAFAESDMVNRLTFPGELGRAAA